MLVASNDLLRKLFDFISNKSFGCTLNWLFDEAWNGLLDSTLCWRWPFDKINDRFDCLLGAMSNDALSWLLDELEENAVENICEAESEI